VVASSDDAVVASVVASVAAVVASVASVAAVVASVASVAAVVAFVVAAVVVVVVVAATVVCLLPKGNLGRNTGTPKPGKRGTSFRLPKIPNCLSSADA
jgi:hypothetical protein